VSVASGSESPPSAGSAAFDELRTRYGNPAIARVRRWPDGHEVGVLSVLFHGPVWSGWWPKTDHMSRTRSFQLTVDWYDDIGDVPDEDIRQESESGWADQLVDLLAGRYLAVTDPDSPQLEKFSLEWVTGEARRALVAERFSGLPKRIRNRPTDLG
jgi:hypothetical protein